MEWEWAWVETLLKHNVHPLNYQLPMPLLVGEIFHWDLSNSSWNTTVQTLVFKSSKLALPTTSSPRTTETLFQPCSNSSCQPSSSPEDIGSAFSLLKVTVSNGVSPLVVQVPLSNSVQQTVSVVADLMNPPKTMQPHLHCHLQQPQLLNQPQPKHQLSPQLQQLVFLNKIANLEDFNVDPLWMNATPFVNVEDALAQTNNVFLDIVNVFQLPTVNLDNVAKWIMVVD